MGKLKKNIKNKKIHVIARPKTRKELRKEKKIQKKENKRIYFSKGTKAKANTSDESNPKKPSKVTSKKSPKKVSFPKENQNDDEEIPSDFSDEEVDAILPKAIKKLKPIAKTKKPVNSRPDAAEIHRREKAREKDLEKASRKQRLKQLKVANEEEDMIISRLEKKLKINRSKDKKRVVQKMFNDGLDYALEFCMDDDDGKERKRDIKKGKEKMDDSDFDEELDDSGSGDDGYGDEDDKIFNDDHDADDSGDQESDQDTPKVKEDIYGRKRDADGNVIQETSSTTSAGKYVPPHQRVASVSEDGGRQEKLLRLRKNCKGFLNRLSELNLHKIANSIENLYMTNSRHDMNETLYALLSEALLTKSLCNERMIQEHIVLLAYLHASVGTEIGAHFLQMFVLKLVEQLHDVTTKHEFQDKQLNNLILVLSYLYMFKIFEHNLLLEIIDRLGDNLCEKTVECLLLIFQSVGFKLRKDDPLAFKNMMQLLQKKIAGSTMEIKENLRLKFMVDILNAVKNNNINKIHQFDPELGENLRKKLKAMLTNDKYVVTLNITIDDLLRADEVGKWWIVGSAWSGNIKDINAANKSTSSTEKQERYSEKLLALAKQQKMNTDDRRNIFCIVMSAEDYVDAFEKILHLALKDQRSIAYVIIHCNLNEIKYNPYYTYLAQKFCQQDRKFQLAFQFASWDRINDLDSLGKQQIKNLAKFLLHLIVKGNLALSALKVVDFVNLDKAHFLLMKEIIVGILLSPQLDCRQIFEKIAKNTKLNNFKSSLRLFMQHFLLKNEAALKLDNEKMILLKKRIDFVDKILAYVDI